MRQYGSHLDRRATYSWTDRVMSRMGQVAALSGRDRLRDALVRLGFPLQ